MKFNKTIAFTLLAATLGLGFSGASQAHGDSLTIRWIDRAYSPDYYTHSHAPYFVKRHFHRHHDRSRYGKRHLSREHHRDHDEHYGRADRGRDYRASNDSDVRYTKRH